MRKLKYLIVLLMLFAVNSKSYSQGISCETAEPFCTDSIYDFPTVIDNYDYFNSSINFGCFGSVINLSWFYLKISEAGDINIHIVINCDNGNAGDVDFVAWGPFDNTTCDENDLYTTATNENGTQQPDNTVEAVWNFNTPHENMVDCGYSELPEEDLFIPNAIVGQYYMVAVMNYGNCVGSINFQKTFGDGETDCSIVYPDDPTDIVAEVNSETICEGDCADISATITTEGTAPYTYAWSDNTLSGAGPHNVCPTSTTTYTVTITDNVGASTTASGTVTINANPTPNITGSSMCTGNSSTLDAGAGYDTYQWSTLDDTQTIDITSTGTYSVTVTDNNNCIGDTSITINSMSNPTPIITGFNFCENLPTTIEVGDASGNGYASYIWNTGETTQSILVSTGGTYSVTVTDNNSCEGSTDINITAYSLPVPTINGDDFCEGTSTILSTSQTYDTYLWNTTENTQQISINAGGSYSVTVTDTHGCEGSTSKSIATIPSPSPTINGNNFCEGTNTTLDAGSGYNSYNWSITGSSQTLDVSSSGTYTVTVTDANSCIGIASINIAEIPNPTPNISGNLNYCAGSSTVLDAGSYQTYSWSNSEPTQTITVNTPGSYGVTVTNSDNCSGSTSVTVNENPIPTPTITGQLAICNGATSTLDAGAGFANYQWSTNQNTQTINVATTGTYTVTVSDNIGCSASTSVDVDVDVVSIGAITDQTICQGNNLDLAVSIISGQAPYTYNWSTGETSSTISVSPNQETTYNVNITDALGCTSNQESVTIHVVEPVELQMSANTDSVCPGDPVIITSVISNGLAPYVLTDANGVNVSTNETVFPTNSGVYTYTVNDACNTSATDMISIFTYPIPALSIQADILQGCQPLLVNFIETSSNDDYSYIWTFESDNEDGLSLSHQTSHWFNTAGIYDVGISVTTDKGCKNSLFINNMINVYKNPDAKFVANPDVVSIINPLIEFNNYSEGATDYIWSFDDTDSSDIENPVHNFYAIGEYNVKLIAISDKGCVDTVYHLVRVEDILTLYVPSAFSPDGDGINDYFFVTGHGIELDAYNIKIYDRWGELIWEDDDLFGKWDGKVKGRFVQAGTYTWLITYKSFTGIEYNKTGIVTIIR